MIPAPSENLILGCAFNYSDKDIQPFLVSLENCGYTDDLILLTNNQSGISLEGHSYNGSTINVDEELKKVKTTEAVNEPQVQQLMNEALHRLEHETNLSKNMMAFFYRSYFLMTSRYFLYYYYLTQWEYSTVLLTDVNDVIFQSHPFERKFEEGVTAFAEYEEIRLKDESTNASWIKETFGEEVLQAMGDEVVYCAGTILLKNKALDFLNQFLRIVINNNVSPAIQGVDQAVYNYMLSFLKLDYFNRKRNGDVVLTVANVPEDLVALTKDGISLHGSNHLPDMVHQYTRFEQQAEYVRQTFCTGA